MLYRLQKPALFLAALLQLVPLARTLCLNPATASTMAFILRWGIGAGAVVGSVDAVSAATSTFSTPGTFSVAAGTSFSNNVTVAIGGGNQAATSDYFIVTAGTTSSAALSNGQGTTVGMPPGLTFVASWVNRATTIGGYISGTPTTAGSYPFSVTCVSPGNAQLSQAITITVTGSVAPTAPAITSQPAASNVVAGKNASFTVTASGTAPLAYFWLKNGNPLANAGNVSGATTATLTLASVSATDAANYSVLVSNSVGTVTSAAAALTVILPPALTSQPVPQTQSVGGTATFSATATGSAPLSYFWLFNGTALVNGAKYSGANSGSLTVTPVATADAGNYSLLVSNLAGTVTSSVAALTVVSSPTILTPPANVSVIAGNAASFTVTATGSAQLSYQWLKNGAPLVSGGNISGTATATLNLSAVTALDAASYSVTVSNALGAITSAAATLTVAVPPAITAQPSGATLLAGTNASFTVIASGTAPLSYQWLKNGVAISGATGATLTLSAITVANTANYSVTVTNAVGTATSTSATLTVLAAPAILTQPANLTVAQGSPASFAVSVSGTAPLSFQWLKYGVALAGATSNVLALSVVTTNDAGNYSVVVTNSVGSLASSSATLTVLVPPTLVTPPSSATVVAGSNVSFTVTAAGNGTLTYQWFKNGVAMPGATTPTLTFAAAAASDAASYTVVVSNAASSVTSSGAVLTVLIAPGITSVPASATVVQGSAAAFTVVASGTAPLTYQWLKNGVALSGAISNVLTLSPATTNDAGNYSVIVTNSVGAITSASATLTVLVAPAIVAPPVNVSVVVSNAATFTVAASGTAPLTYQWLKNGTNLPGALAATLTLVKVSALDAASYSVVVSNAAGTVTSGSAVLTVQFPPAIVTSPVSQFGALGSAISLSVVASGTGPLRYQWFSPTGALVDGANISGSSSNRLTIAALTTNNVGNYFVVISNAYGSVTSTSAAITVNASPIITRPPANLFAAVGSNAVLTVAVSGTSPFTYQWLKNGAKIGNSSTVSGATSNTLQLAKVAIAASGNYSVVVKNSYGSATSAAAKLSVLLPPSISAALVIKPAMRMTTAPVGVLVKAGTNITFLITATGGAPLSYQWFKDDTALVNGGSLSGATTNALKISALTTNDSGVYSVIIRNPVGSVTNRSALTVIAPPVITLQPLSQSVTSGNSVIFSVANTGTAPFSYQWYKASKVIPGATNTIFRLSRISSSNAGTYFVVITNLAGRVTSASASLTVQTQSGGGDGGTDNLRINNSASVLTVAPLQPFIAQLLRNPDGSITLNCSGTAGSNYVVQASADLTSWLDISTNTAAGGQWQMMDNTRANSRFYRLKSAP